MSLVEIPPADDLRLKDDLLSGADAIGAFLGKDARAVYYLVSKGQLPAFRLGSVLHARKSTLVRFLEQREHEAISHHSARK